MSRVERLYQNLAWATPGPLSFLLEEKLTFLFSEKRNGPSVNATPDQSYSDRQCRIKDKTNTPFMKRRQQPRVQDVLLRLPTVVPENMRTHF